MRSMKFVVAWIALSTFVLALDYVTGPYIEFPIFYLCPIALAAWHTGMKYGFGLSVALPLIRAAFDPHWDVPWTYVETAINTVDSISVFLLFSFLIARVAKQTQKLERDVRVLEGIMPICSFCKKIRTEEGNWQQLESFISSKSEAEFSHSVCPQCLDTHYPEYSQK